MSAIVSVGNTNGQYYVKLANGKNEVKIPCKSEEEANALKTQAEQIEAQKEGKTNAAGDTQATAQTAQTNPAEAPAAPTAAQPSAFEGPQPDAAAINQATLDDSQGKKFQACA